MGDFSKSRNKFRRTYPFSGNRPKYIRTPYFLDSLGEVRYFNKNQFERHYDHYLIRDSNEGVDWYFNINEYEEDFVSLSDQDSANVSFTTTFSGVPVLVVYVEVLGDPGENINPYIISLTNTGFEVGTSFKFTGWLHYRASYATSYPAICERVPAFPGIIAIINAGKVEITGQDSLTATYTSFGSVPSEAYFSPCDINGISDVDIYVSASSVGLNSATAELSSEFYNEINYMVIK